MSKGSARRPKSVSREEYERRYERAMRRDGVVYWRGRPVMEMRRTIDPKAVYPYRRGLY